MVRCVQIPEHVPLLKAFIKWYHPKYQSVKTTGHKQVTDSVGASETDPHR